MTSLKAKQKIHDRLTLVIDRFCKNGNGCTERDSTLALLEKLVEWAKDAGLEEMRNDGHDV